MRKECLQRKSKELKRKQIYPRDRISYLRMDKRRLSKRNNKEKEANRIILSRKLKILRRLQANMDFKREIL